MRKFKTSGKHLKVQTGFTLIELLVVLSLLGIILGAGYAALNGTFVAWAYNEAINPHIASTNVTLTQLSRDIRSSESPDASTSAVVVSDDGNQMTIYKHKADSTWDMICYRYNGTNLQRAVANEENSAAVAALAFPGNEAAWQNLLPCVATAAQANSFKTEGNKIQIALKVSDVDHPDKKRFADYQVASTYFPRNAAADSLLNQESEEEEEIVIAPAPIYDLVLGTHDATITVGQVLPVSITFKPYNTKAADKKVKFELDILLDAGIYDATQYISVVQDANDPSLIRITGKKKTPTFLGIPYNAEIKVISTNNASANDEIKIKVK